MKLTVGPLPTVVYWRRRAVLLGGMLVAASMLWVSCATVSKSAPAAKQSALPTTEVTVSGSAAGLLTPITPGALDSLPSVTTASTPAPAVNPPPPGNAAPAPACTDAEIQLSPVADQVTAKRGATLRFSLKVKNISTHPCSRDLGADPQELYLQQGTAKVWSSDACNALHGTNMQTLAAGDEQAFYVPWKGKSNTAGCDETKWKAPPAGKYELIGRLATKISEPFTLTLT
jgi:hypothetical protein